MNHDARRVSRLTPEEDAVDDPDDEIDDTLPADLWFRRRRGARDRRPDHATGRARG